MYENGAPAPAARRAGAHLAAGGPLLRVVRAGAAHLDGPRLADSLELFWNQQLLDVLLEYPIQSDHSDFSIDPRVARLGRTSDHPALPAARRRNARVRVPRRSGPRAPRPALVPGRAALRGLGFRHILDGTDHLLFLLCLVIPFRRLRPLVMIVTAFTVAHSITLIASASGFAPDALWFPPLIETLIAVSIVYMALENIVYAALGQKAICRGAGSSPSRSASFTASGSRLRCANLCNSPATTS